MCNKQYLRSACAHAQFDQNLYESLEHFTTVTLLNEHHLEFLSLKGGAQAGLSLHLSKCHIVGNHSHVMAHIGYKVHMITLRIL